MKKCLLVTLFFPLFFVENTSAQSFSLLKDINSNSEGSTPDNFTQAPGGLTYFTAVYNNVRYLWKTDGTESGTTRIEGVLAQQSGMLFTNGILFKTII